MLNQLNTTIWRHVASGDIVPPISNCVPDGNESLVSRLRRCMAGDRAPDTHQREDWVDPKVGLDAVEKRKTFCPCRKSNSCSSYRSPSPQRLNSPGSVKSRKIISIVFVNFFIRYEYFWHKILINVLDTGICSLPRST